MSAPQYLNNMTVSSASVLDLLMLVLT